jgi:hypothetical protein
LRERSDILQKNEEEIRALFIKHKKLEEDYQDKR